MFWSSRGGRVSVAVRAGADFDECPDAEAVDGGGVELVVEGDGDGLASWGAAVGEVGVADVAACLHRADVLEGACAGGTAAGPGAVLPGPDFGFEFAAVAIAVDEGEAVVAIAGDSDDAGVAGMPSAVGEDIFCGEGAVVRLHQRVRSAGPPYPDRTSPGSPKKVRGTTAAAFLPPCYSDCPRPGGVIGAVTGQRMKATTSSTPAMDRPRRTPTWSARKPTAGGPARKAT